MSDHSLLLESPPPGWTPARFGDICDRVQDAASPLANGKRLYLGLEHLASGHPTLVGRGKESDVRSGKTEFHKRDVLFGKLRPYLRKSVLVSEDGICSTDILVFRAAEKCIPEFLCLLTHTDQFVGHAKATTSGVQHPRTSWGGLRDLRLHVPPLPEQSKIAAVLGVVQGAIEQQERLLQLIAELKKTLLHQLFTQGLRGEPQKQTEIGPVPESWEVMKLRDLCDLIVDCPHTTPKFQTEGIRVARNFNIRDGRFVAAPAFYTTKEEYQQRIKRAEPLPGDILFSREAPVGEACAIPEGMKLSLGQRIMLLRASEGKLDAQFMVYCFYAPNVRPRMLASSSGLTVPHLNVADVRDLSVPIPPLCDQQQIATAILTVDTKGECHRKKHAALTALFRTLLHQLMTAQIRVHDLDLSALGVTGLSIENSEQKNNKP
ncbi:MAG: restriction endonuclease subunit S [Chromatiales bacterium]